MPTVWRELQRPKNWNPRTCGECLVGVYLGLTYRNGKYGMYNAAIIASPAAEGFGESHLVSGTDLMRIMGGVILPAGSLVRIVFCGYRDIGYGRQMKVFEVHVAIGTMPVVNPPSFASQVLPEPA